MAMQKKFAAPGKAMPVRVFAVGDDCIGARGLAEIVADDPSYSVCGQANSFEEANRLIRDCQPDVLLIEPFIQNIDGIRWIKDLVSDYPGLRILVVSRQPEQTFAERTLRAGAAGYWMKSSSVSELMHALGTVVADEIY